MNDENRQLPRYPDFARAKIRELCQLPGYLEDVCKNGCRVRFPNAVSIDTDREYTLAILPALRCGIGEFDLIVSPQWIREERDSVEIGFSVLHCPGIRQFMRYVEILSELEEEILQEA
jgi:hypothetical protein